MIYLAIILCGLVLAWPIIRSLRRMRALNYFSPAIAPARKKGRVKK